AGGRRAARSRPAGTRWPPGDRLSSIARRYFVRGMEAMRRGETDNARDDLRAALDVAPSFVGARVAYANALARAGDANRAALPHPDRAGRPRLAPAPGARHTQRAPMLPPHHAGLLLDAQHHRGDVVDAASGQRGADHRVGALLERAPAVLRVLEQLLEHPVV